MKVIEIKNKQLHQGERPAPVPGKDEVLIKVAAAGVNRADILQRLGKYPPPEGVTDIPGLEVSGIIESTGERVCALLEGGGYSEYALAARDLCLPVPENLSLPEAAALPEAIFTVWKNLFIAGELKPGETALVHGGSSGIGTMAIQMARQMGSKIIVTAGSDAKCEACRNLGADLSVNYRDTDFTGQALAFTGGRGVDVVLDIVGGDYVQRNLDCLAPQGRHVSIAFMKGPSASISLNTIIRKNLTLTGSTLRGSDRREKAGLADQIREKVWPLVTAGRIKPVIHASIPLANAPRAHEILEAGAHFGKIILT